MDTSEIKVTYHFQIGETRVSFPLRFDSERFDLLDNPPADDLPAWTRLTEHQCPHCPLSADNHPHCPLASAISRVVTNFHDTLSYTPVDVEVVTAERTISTSTTAQRGVSSLIGIIGPASGCPHTAYFKPMARFHLPFATEQETIYRATSMFLLAHFFQSNTDDDWLEKSKHIYENMGILNNAFAQRLRTVSGKDAPINALVILDLFAKVMPYIIEDRLEELMKVFTPYLTKAAQN